MPFKILIPLALLSELRDVKTIHVGTMGSIVLKAVLSFWVGSGRA